MANPSDLLLGTGLLAGSALLGKEPGEVVEARQHLRNRFTSPTSYTQGLSQQVGGLQQYFDPLIQQQQKRSLDEISQRYTAAFPGRVGAQPQEFKGYETYLRDQFQPGVQAFYGNLGLNRLNAQDEAARNILSTSKPDATSEALGKLATIMLAGGFGRQGGLTGGQGSVGGLLDQLLRGSGTGTGGGGGDGLLSNIGNLFKSGNTAGAAQQLSSLGLSFGRSLAGGGSVELLEAATGYPVGMMGSDGVITDMFGNPMAASALGGAGKTSGLTSFLGGTGGTMSGLLGALGAATAGFGSGNLIGGLIPSSRAGGTAAGAAGGAAAGAIMGSILPGIGTAIGAAIGALAGAAGGFGGSRGADHAFKAQRLSADMASQGNNVGKEASFWTAALGEAGFSDLDGFGAFANGEIAAVNQGARPVSYGGISGTWDQPNSIISIGSKLLLREIQKKSPQITSLDQVPNMRQGYIDFIMQNYRIERGGSSVPIENIGQAAGNVRDAGFPI